MKRDPFWKAVALLAGLLLVFGLAGNWDYEDAVRQDQEYCDMVKHGLWPDYRGDYCQTCLKAQK